VARCCDAQLARFASDRFKPLPPPAYEMKFNALPGEGQSNRRADTGSASGDHSRSALE
jgi:hypothetical protein